MREQEGESFLPDFRSNILSPAPNAQALSLQIGSSFEGGKKVRRPLSGKNYVNVYKNSKNRLSSNKSK